MNTKLAKSLLLASALLLVNTVQASYAQTCCVSANVDTTAITDFPNCVIDTGLAGRSGSLRCGVPSFGQALVHTFMGMGITAFVRKCRGNKFCTPNYPEGYGYSASRAPVYSNLGSVWY